MTEYSDLPEVNALYAEQAQIEQALNILDNQEGTVSAYTVVPTIAPDGGLPAGGLTINTIAPGQSLLSGVRSSLIQRNNQINKELRDLGVTGVPDDKPGGGPPLSEAQPA